MVKLAAALFFLFPLLPVVAVPLRWAILGDSGPQARKTADLLLAGLSGNPQMVFVERDSLTEVTEEAELNALLDAAGSSRRARLLGLIKADRLVVLSTRAANAQPTLQVVIAESAQGARLAAIEFPIDPEQELVGRIIQLIQATNQHYADGIKAVVGVAPLTPENLEQGDDSLITTYRDLLQGELSLLPGVAVIEMDEQLDECLYYFNELFPDDNWMSYGMATFIGTDRRDWAGLAVIGDARWLSFLDQLSRSKKPRVRLLAEYGKIRFEVMVGKELNASEKTALFARAKKWWLATGQPLHWHNREIFSEPVFEDMRGILNRLEPPAEEETSMLPPDPVKPANWQTDPSSWEYWGCPYMLGHLRFKELPVQTANPLPAKLAFTKGDNQADYLWNESGIWLLDARLKVSPIAADAAVPIRDVKWDGEYLWVLSGLNKGKSDCSLAIYDRQGRRVAGVNTAGFSAHDRSMRMAMMRKGVACVAGTFQPYNRTWLALATLSGGKIEIKEFHHAKELPTAQQNSMDFGNTNMAFVPIWMQVMCLEPGEPDYLLIGRHYATTGEDWHPLMINTITLDVSVHPYWMNGRSGLNQDYLCHNGEMFVPNDWGVSVFPRLSENPPKSRKIDDQVPPRQLGKKGGSFVTQFIHQGSIHIIGYKWIRVDLATLNEEEMTLGYIPRKWQMQWYASSDSHGIIGYNGRLFSISFAEKLLFTQDE